MRKQKHNRNKIFCLFAISLLLSLAACAKTEIKNIDSKGKNIVCFGDSITFGYGVKPQEAFANLLAEMLNLPVINSGLDGDSSVTALKRLRIDVLERDPLLVIIEFAGNDFLRKVPLEETMRNIEEMIIRIHSSGAMVAIADVSYGVIMKDYSRGFRNLCAKYSAIYIPDLLKGIVTNPSLRSDFIHPNAQGHKVIAQRIYRQVNPCLNRNAILRKFEN